MTSIEKLLINSEEYIRKLFEGIPIPIYVWQRHDNDFILVDYNDATNRDLTGKFKKKIGVKASEFYKDNPKIIQDLNKCFIKQKNISKEIDYTVKSTQELRSLSIRYSFIPPELVLIHLEDITEKRFAKQKIIASEMKCKQLNKELEQKVKERTKELEESEEKYRTVVEKSLQGICILQDIKFIFTNNALAEILGYSVNELYSLSTEEVVNLIYIEDRNFVLKRHKERLKGKKVPSHYAFRVIRKNKEIRWVEMYATLIEYDGKPAVQELFIDITEKKLAEVKLKESEAKYRAMTELLPDIIYEADLNLNITYVNPIGFKKFGYTPEDLNRGVNIKNLVSPEYAEKAFSTIKSIFKRNITEPTEYLMVRKNGTKFYARVHSRPIIKNEKVVGLRGTVTDINDMVIAEQKLKESENHLQERVKELNCLYGISKIAESPNISYKELILETLKLIPPAWQTPDITYARIIYEDMEYKTKDFKESNWKLATNIEINKKPMDIEVYYHIDKVQFLKEEEYLIKEIGKRLKTIIEKKISEKKLKESEKLYREAFNRASFYKDLFAHDINNILQIMNSSAELISLQLKDSDRIEDIENIANIIKKQVNRGTKLVNNVRLLSELEESEISIQPTKACDILLKSVEYVKKAYSDREINIKIECSDDEIYIIANELLQDVFENILINAIKYNENPSIDILINAYRWTYENNPYYRFEFIDNGIGIQDERKKIIFERKNGDLRSDKGMGLGLSLVSKIVNYYHGKIWIEDKVKGDYSKGSKFVIILPESNDLTLKKN